VEVLLLRVKGVVEVSEMCGCARQRCVGRTGKVESCKEKITTEYKWRTVAAWLRLGSIVVVQRSKEKGARKEEREKGSGCEGGKRWNLLELSCARGQEGDGREALKISEKVERVADGRSDTSFRSAPRPTKCTL
jgi:hypothetical protein